MNLRSARRIAVIAIVASLSLTALIGIITLLSGDFGETQGKVLLTTLLLAAFSITVLCHLAVIGRALQLVGFVGVGISAVALVCGLLLIWRDWNNYYDIEPLLKTFGVFGVLAVSFAHANLLLLLGQRRNPVVRLLLYITVGIIGVVALMLSLPIGSGGEIPGEDGDWYWRLLGVVAILDVLGSIVLPVTGRLLRDDRAVRLDLDLSEDLDARLTAAATKAGTSKVAAAIAALDKGL
jgi:hypothetical protein